MIDWFRSWHGAPTDNKWLVIARRAGVTPGIVSAFVWALFDHASQSADRGDVRDFDFETYSAFSGWDEENLRAVYSALIDKNIIQDGRLVAWEKRQTKRPDDTSTERVRAHRERAETQRNATKHAETPDKIREDKIRENNLPPIVPPPVPAVADATRRSGVEKSFSEFWEAYPRRDGANPRKPARKAFEVAVRAGTLPETIIAGARGYAQQLRDGGKFGTQFVAQAVTWLHQARWEETSLLAEPTGPPAGNAWKPGMPTADELRAKYAAKHEVKRNRHEQMEPMAQASLAARSPERELFRGNPSEPGIRRLGGILRENGLDADHISGRRIHQIVDSAVPVAGMADD